MALEPARAGELLVLQIYMTGNVYNRQNKVEQKRTRMKKEREKKNK